MRTKVQKLIDHRRRLDKKQSEIDAMKREEIKLGMEAIFEKLGIRAVVPVGYLNHHSGQVTISFSEGGYSTPSGFMIENKTKGLNGVKLALHVKDENNEHLETFKRLLEITNA